MLILEHGDKPSRKLVADEQNGFASPLAGWQDSAQFDSDRSTASSCGSHRGLVPPRPELLQKEDIPWILTMLSPEDKSHFGRSLFLVDCRRRYRELEKDESKLLGYEKLQQGIVKMFPCLSLDFIAEGRCVEAVEKNLPNFLSIFDADSDGFLSEKDFVDLITFCHAWRASFYMKAGDLRLSASGMKGGRSPTSPLSPLSPASPALQAAARGILQGSTSQGALQPKADVACKSAKPVLRRRGSGFGERLFVSEPALETPPKELPTPAPVTTEEADRKESKETRARQPRRLSAPAVLDVNFMCDASRGATYASLSGWVNRFGSQSRESSPALSSASEFD